MKTWCQHVIWNEEIKQWMLPGTAYMREEWDICPIKGCHKERPKEPMKLENLIRQGIYVDKSFRSVADEVLEAVFEVIDEFGGEQCLTDVGIIKQAIRERLT